MGNIPPSFFRDNAIVLDKAYTDALDEVVATSTQFATYNTLPQNKINYDNAIQGLAGVESTYGFYKSFLMTCLQASDKNIKQMDSSTTLIVAANETLKQRVVDMTGNEHAAYGAVQDSHELYNQHLLANAILGLFICGACYLYYVNDTVQYADLRKSYGWLGALCVLTVLITWSLLRKGWKKIAHRL